MLEGSSERKSAPLLVIPMAAVLVLAAVVGAVVGILWESSKEATALAEKEAAATAQASDTTG